MDHSRPVASAEPSPTGEDKLLKACGKEEFDRESKLMGLFIENAATYTKLSSAALLLTVTFLEKVVGVEKGPIPKSATLIICWVCFLLAILSGVTYQYFAVKFLEWRSGILRKHENFCEYLVQHPWPMYASMLVAFYLGAVFFTAFAIQRVLG